MGSSMTFEERSTSCANCLPSASSFSREYRLTPLPTLRWRMALISAWGGTFLDWGGGRADRSRKMSGKTTHNAKTETRSWGVIISLLGGGSLGKEAALLDADC